MAERRTTRSGTGGRASTRSRESSGRDEREILEDEREILEEEPEALEEEPEALEDDEILDVDESEEAGDMGEPEADDQDESPDDGRRRPSGRGRKAMTAGEAAKTALGLLTGLTEKRPEGVTGVQRTEEGWAVGVELVEDPRIPSSSDILAMYETIIDADGELVSYRRIRRYARGRGDTEEA